MASIGRYEAINSSFEWLGSATTDGLHVKAYGLKFFDVHYFATIEDEGGFKHLFVHLLVIQFLDMHQLSISYCLIMIV